MNEPNKKEVLYFGCIGDVGHHLHSKTRIVSYYDTPWGIHLDGGCFPEKSQHGILYTSKKSGWTAICVWDNGVDTRGGSHSTFVIADDLSTEELLAKAKTQWPEVFGRRGFPKFTFDPMGRDAPLTLEQICETARQMSVAITKLPEYGDPLKRIALDYMRVDFYHASNLRQHLVKPT